MHCSNIAANLRHSVRYAAQCCVFAAMAAVFPAAPSLAAHDACHSAASANPPVLSSLVEICTKRGNSAFRSGSSRAAAYGNLAHGLATLGRPSLQVLAAADRAAELDPAIASVHNARAAALIDLGRYDEALAAARRATSLKDGYSSAYGNLSLALILLKRYDDALRAAEQALRLEPTNSLAIAVKTRAAARLRRASTSPRGSARLSEAANEEFALEDALAAYDRGEFPAAKDVLIRFAQSGSMEAQYRLGLMYFSAAGGIPQSDREAVGWYRKAAAQGLADAQYDLAYMIEGGRGVASSDPEALHWYRLAARQGHDLAAQALAKIEEKIQRAEIAQTLARQEEANRAEAARVAAQEEVRRKETLRLAAVEAERQRLAELKEGLMALDAVTPIVNANAIVREQPERGAKKLRELSRNEQVHAIGILPSGWVQIAVEGEPFGWVFKTALAPDALTALPGRAGPTAAAVLETLDLEPLDTRFRVRAAANVRSAPDLTASRVTGLRGGEIVTALAKVSGQDWFLVERDGERLGFVFGALLEPAQSTRRNINAVAVVIGNKSYVGDIPEVDYALNDADAMKRYLIYSLGYRQGNIIDVRDATLGDLQRIFGTEREHRGRLFDFIRDGESDVTVFYSGHGVPGLNDKRGYLLPIDGDPDRAEIAGFSLDVLLANLAKLPARSMHVFLDACFSGNSAGGMLIQATSGIGISPALPDAAANFVMLTAASGDQVASWDRDTKHGLFTKHLLEALNGKADASEYGNGDGAVTLEEVQTYLDQEMTFQARRRFGRDQNASTIGIGDTVLHTL